MDSENKRQKFNLAYYASCLSTMISDKRFPENLLESESFPEDGRDEDIAEILVEKVTLQRNMDKALEIAQYVIENSLLNADINISAEDLALLIIYMVFGVGRHVAKDILEPLKCLLVRYKDSLIVIYYAGYEALELMEKEKGNAKDGEGTTLK